MISDNMADLLETYRSKVLKAVVHLEYSYNKVAQLPFHFAQLNEETWESFSARFNLQAFRESN